MTVPYSLEELKALTPLWAYFVVIWLAAQLVYEGGIAISRRSAAATRKSSSDGANTIVSAAIGLLALLIAFTFSMGLNRYEMRRDLVVAEANAIGTTYLRAKLFAEPERTEMLKLLREYTDVRLAYFTADDHPRKLAALNRTIDRLQHGLWESTTRLVEPVKTTALAASFLTTMNETLDLAATRRAARNSGIPDTMIVVVLVYLAATACILGYADGGEKQRFRPVVAVFFGLVSLALIVTADLNRQGSGTIRISDAPLRDVRASMN